MYKVKGVPEVLAKQYALTRFESPNHMCTVKMLGHGKLKIGTEIELSNPSDASRRLLKEEHGSSIPEFFSFGWDCTAGPNAIEMRSLPMTWTEIKRHSSDINLTMRILNSLGYDGVNISKTNDHVCCGMHVHISREAFKNDKHIMKYLKFVNGNEKFSLFVGERVGTYHRHYLRFDREIKQTKPLVSGLYSNYKRHDTFSTGHYDAANANRQTTIETRIFQGDTGFTRYMKAIDFCRALFKFSSLKVQQTPLNFVDFVKTSSDYNYLNDFFTNKESKLLEVI